MGICEYLVVSEGGGGYFEYLGASEYPAVIEGWVCAYLNVDEDTIAFNDLTHSYLSPQLLSFSMTMEYSSTTTTN